MVSLGFFGRVGKVLDERKFIIIIVLLLVFAAYRIMRYSGAFRSISWLDAPGVFSPGVFDVVIFSLAVVFFFIAYRFCSGTERRRIILIFLASFFMFAGFTQLIQPVWIDAQGYYDLGVIGAEQGPLYLIQNYHTLNTNWTEETLNSVEDGLRFYGIYEWGKEKLRPEIGEPNVYSSRTQLHPPLWPVLLSVFMIVFGVSELAALLFTWIIVSFSVVVFYLLIKRIAGGDTAMKMSYFLVIIPVSIIISYAPLSDGLLMLFVVASLYFFVSKNKVKQNMFLSGLFLALAFYTKFTVVLLFPVLFLLLFIRSGLRKTIINFSVLLSPLVIVSAVFMSLNYFFMLTMITAGASMPARLEVVVTNWFVSYFVMPFYYLVYFSIPIVFLLLLVFLRSLDSVKVKENVVQILVILSLMAFMLIYPNKLGLERLALPYFLLAMAFSSKSLGKHLRDDRFVSFILVIILIQSVTFLI
jgi:hypothetical protein